MTANATRRGVAVLFLAVASCKMEAGDCEELRREGECLDADVESGACVWVEEIRSSSSCGDVHVGGMCVGISGPQQGCGSHQCEGSPDGVNAYYRVNGDDSVSVFVNPECGPTPVGDWEPCFGGGQTKCDCACPPG